jgi:NADP-dependent aldehyde dehydrogenase
MPPQSQTDSVAESLTGAMFLGAERVIGRAGQVRAVDPRTGAELEPAYWLGGPGEVALAARLAGEAARSYRQTGLEERAAFLEQIADNIDSLGDVLVQRVQQETGIVEARVRGEMTRTTNQLRLFASVVREGSWVGVRIDPALPDRTPLPRPDIRQRKLPVGPVAVFGASNFPLAFSVAGGDTAAALAAGCPVVVKAHSAHPGVSELVAGAIAEAVRQQGLAEGVFSMVYGNGQDVGVRLVSDPHIKAVGFTGSRQAGLALMAAAAARPVPIPVYAEMSSINPVFLMPGAMATDAERLGRDYVASLTVGVGQLCTNPGLVFAVDGPDLDDFVKATGAAVAESSALPMLNAAIQRSYLAGVQRLQSLEAVSEVSSGRVDDSIAAPGQAHVFETSGEDFATEPALREEVFGSTSVVVRLRDAGELASAAASLEGQLTATLHAAKSDHPLAAELLSVLEEKVGRIVFNGWPTGVEVGHAMVHGGPFPATADGRSTSVGTLAIERFLRPVAYQDAPPGLLPEALADGNPQGLWRLVDGQLSRD